MNYLLGATQKDFPMSLIHVYCNNNYKSLKRKHTFFNKDDRRVEKWHESKHLGTKSFLFGGSGLSLYAGTAFSDETAMRKYHDIFKYKYEKLEKKLAEDEPKMAFR